MNAEAEAIRLLLVDDHALFREGLVRLLEREADMEVVGKCSTAGEALAALNQSQATMILLDFDLGSERALEFVQTAKAGGFLGQILVVTAGVSDQEAVQLVQAGVAGILHKHNPPDALCRAIRKVAGGEACLEESYLKPLFGAVDQTRTADRPKLTDRDRTVLRLIFQGLANKEIAARLDLSEGAVKASLRLLFQKLGVRTRAQLVKVALEQYRDQL
jgi:two-component system, NarL family, nitrate/nitrite response regulator NarL